MNQRNKSRDNTSLPNSSGRFRGKPPPKPVPIIMIEEADQHGPT